MKENLILVGGVQEKLEAESFTLLLFKLDRAVLATDAYQYDVRAALIEESLDAESLDRAIKKRIEL